MSLIIEKGHQQRFSLFFGWLPLIFSAIIVVAINLLNARYNAVINRTLVFVLLMLTLRCIDNKWVRNSFAIVALSLVAADLALQVYAWRNFDTAFTYGFALSVLNTTGSEAAAMLSLYWRDGVLFLLILALLLYTANSGRHTIAPKWRKLPAIVFILLLMGYTVQGVLHQMRKSNVESLMQRIVHSTPISTSRVFMQAAEDIAVAADINSNTPVYQLTTRDTGIDNYVLIVGESARMANMGIYGYSRDTTPQLNNQKANLLLFRNAISPAPVTIMAVPLALSANSVREKEVAKNGDNIVSIANQAGFDTYWYSRQGKGGAHNNVITGIAMNTREHQWVNEGYDDALLPLLSQALNKPGKKLIVLHIYGSHEPSCRRFPAEKTVLRGASQADDCYDNSIRFTDEVMGEIFAQLDNTRSSLLYFSDHALIRDPDRAVVYSHGGANPPKEALQVPTFIWYSPKVAADNKWTGEYRTPWSTDELNTLSELWLGIQRKGNAPGNVAGWLQQYRTPVMVMDTTGKTYEWHQVR